MKTNRNTLLPPSLLPPHTYNTILQVCVTLNSVPFFIETTRPIHSHPVTPPTTTTFLILSSKTVSPHVVRAARANARLLCYTPVDHTASQNACCSRCRCKGPLSAFFNGRFLSISNYSKTHDTLWCHSLTSSIFQNCQLCLFCRSMPIIGPCQPPP